MASTRVIVGTVVAGAALTLGLACSSTATGEGSSGTSGGAATSGGPSGGGTSGGGTSGSTGSAIKNCSTSSDKSTCTDAEIKPYSDCINDKCGAKFAECYGPGYKTGNFGGPCGTYITCSNACACNDTTCYQKCGTPAPACSTCLQGVGTCTSACTAPACATASTSSSSGGPGAKSCADLKACCDAIVDPAKKTECNQTYSAVKASEASCNAIYTTYAAQCPKLNGAQ